MKHVLMKSVKVLLFIIIFLVSLSFFLVATNSGLKLDVLLIKKISGKRLSIKEAHGNLSSHLLLKDVNFKSKDFNLEIKKLNLSWSLFKSLISGPNITNLTLDNVTLKTHRKLTANQKNTQTLKSSYLKPIDIKKTRQKIVNYFKNFNFNLENIKVNNLHYQSPNQKFSLNNLTINASSNGSIFHITNTKALLDDNQSISLNGTVNIKSNQETQLHLETQGPIELASKITGNVNLHRWQTVITKPLNATATLSLNDELDFKGLLRAKHGFWPLSGKRLFQIKKLEAHIEGNPNQYNLNAKGQIVIKELPKQTFNLSASGNSSYVKVERFKISDGKADTDLKAELEWFPLIRWHSHLTIKNLQVNHYLPKVPGEINVSASSNGSIKNKILKTDNQLDINGTLFNQPLNIQAMYDPIEKNIHSFFTLANNKLEIKGNSDLPLHVTLNIPSLHTFLPYFKNVHAGVKARGIIDRKSNLKITLSPGYLTLIKQTPLYFKKSILEISHSHPSFNVLGAFKIDDKKRVILKAKLPSLKQWPFIEKKVTGIVRIDINDINALDKLLPEIKKTHGKLNGYIAFNGPLQQLKPKLNLNLKHGQTNIPAIGLSLSNINLNLKSENNNYLIKGSLQSLEGLLNINGEASYQHAHLLTTLNLKGNNINILNTDEYKINASPQIKLKSDNKHILLNGDLTIDSATVTPHDFSSTIELPDDVIIIGESNLADSAFAFGYHLNLALGEKANVSIAGLSGTLTGNVTLNAPINQSFTATGSLNIKNGTYQAYGQDLKITQGRLIYAGGPLNNPGIFIQASRSLATNNQYNTDFNQDFSSSSNKITVGINVRGRLKSPKSTLFSIPSSHSQSDILSMLVLGKPISQASDVGSDSALSSSQLLISALSKLNLGNGSSGQQLTQQLEHALGIDELNLENQSIYDSKTDTVSENTALTIGKSISSKLSLHYSIGFVQGANVLKIKYQFSPRWAIQTESNGNTNGVDIIYNYHK